MTLDQENFMSLDDFKFLLILSEFSWDLAVEYKDGIFDCLLKGSWDIEL